MNEQLKQFGSATARLVGECELDKRLSRAFTDQLCKTITTSILKSTPSKHNMNVASGVGEGGKLI